MHIEIFDECSFTADELIAWAYIPIPRAVLDEGKTVDEWFSLSGKQGEDQEGHINLVLSYSVSRPPFVVPNRGKRVEKSFCVETKL